MKHPLLKGYLLLLLVAAIWGTLFSMIKIGVTEIGPATLTAGALIAGTIFAFIFAFVLENPIQMNWNSRAIVPMVLLGLFPTALASVLYFRLVRNLGATRFAQINYIIPVLGSIIGVYFMGEQTEWRMWLALALVLSGIFLVHGARRGAPRVL